MKRNRARKEVQCSGPKCKERVNALEYLIEDGYPVFCSNRCKMAERQARKRNKLQRCLSCGRPFRPVTLENGKCKVCRRKECVRVVNP